MAITVCILGSTGSIGQQTLDVIREHQEHFKVLALTAHSKTDILFKQCQEFHPEYVVCVNPQAACLLREQLAQARLAIDVLEGAQALIDVAADTATAMVVAAIVGAAGLPATFAAVKAGKTILLANKEALVMSGALFMDAVRHYGATLLPVDSEHNALFQCMPAGYLPGQPKPQQVDGIILTASGGPFLHRELDTFTTITPQEAVAHPNWSMGAKISVDSATMMNKGLEVIEAHWLFDMPQHTIEVVMHPQSVIHSLLRYVDGSILAQCGVADMRTPLAYCMGWPHRLSVSVQRLNLCEVGRFDFFAPDFVRFPCLRYAYQALEAGPVATLVLNTVNELAVAAFLQGRISYLKIAEIIEQSLSEFDFAPPRTIEDAIEIDHKIRSETFCIAIN